MTKHKSTENILIKMRTLAKHDFSRSVFVAILWQFVITTFAIIITRSLSDQVIPSATATETVTNYLFSYTTHWDGVWYLGIINGSYFDPASFSSVFYPLFPGVIWLLNTITFGLIDLPVLGLLFNTLCIALAVFSLKRISSHLLPRINPWITPVLFLLAPTALFLNAFYTEALLCALGFFAYYLALERKWLIACIVLMFATSTKLAGLLFVGLCALEFAKAYEWNIRKIFNPKIFYFLLAPLGFIAYSFFLSFAQGDALAMFHDISPWTYNQLNLNFLETLYISTRHAIGGLLHGDFDYIGLVSFLLPVISIGLVFFTSLYTAIKLKNIPLAIFGFVAIVMFSLNDNVVSVHRYMLPVLTVYVALAALLNHRLLKPFIMVVIYSGILVQSLLLILFSLNVFAG